MPEMMPNAFSSQAANLDAQMSALVCRRNQSMASSYRLQYQNPIEVDRAQGVYLYDSNGDAYLDFYNNVASLGHSHPKIVAAISEQAAKLCTNTRYLSDTVIGYAENLTRLFPDPLTRAIFTCSGSEANDVACRIAMQETGNTGFVVTDFAYHGTTHLVASMSPNLRGVSAIADNIRAIPAPLDLQSAQDTSFQRALEKAIQDLKESDFGFAGFVADSVFSSDGLAADPAGFLRPIIDTVHAHGGLYIADEVQPGFGRTGEHMWGFQRHDIVPDLVTLGKPMGNGYPISGVIGSPERFAVFGREARYFNTFGGNTVAAAAGQAVLDVIAQEEILDNVRQRGRELLSGLEDISSSASACAKVRGCGLYYGIDVVDDEGAPSAPIATDIVNRLRKNRVLISLTGKHAATLKIRPPLVCKSGHVADFLEHLRDAVSI